MALPEIILMQGAPQILSVDQLSNQQQVLWCGDRIFTLTSRAQLTRQAQDLLDRSIDSYEEPDKEVDALH